MGPGMPPGIPSTSIISGDSGGGEASGGGEMSGGVGYARGGMVRPRMRRRRRRRLLRRRMGPPGMPPRIRRRKRMLRRRPTGYAKGGSVNPLLMSTSLDSRKDNPMHYAEDREPLSTRPAGAPGAPDDYGYQEGGEVLDEDEQWEEPDDTTDDEEEGATSEPDDESEGEFDDQAAPLPQLPLDEAEAEDEEPPGGRQRAIPEEEGEEEEEPPPEEEGGGAGGGGPSGGGGGGGPEGAQPKTGYDKGDQDEGDQPQQQQDTGFDQSQAAPTSSPLKEVLDYTRKQMGVEGQKEAKAPAETPADTTQERQRTAASQAQAQTADASGSSGVVTPDQGETAPPQQPAGAPQEEPAPKIPTPPKQGAATQPSGTASGPGNMQAIQDYVSGKGAYTPEQMTELLDRTAQTNPNLGQNGAIQQAFKNLMDKNDVDGASKFVQALRPSYDSVRALMIAATSKGDFQTAMQLAERLNNLIPNGQEARFTQLPDGRVLATIQPQDGGPMVQHAMTQEQFARYANSPLSLFDHVAEQGLDKNFQMLTGQPGQTAASTRQLAGTQYAQNTVPNTGGVMSDAGPITPGPATRAPMPTGYGVRTPEQQAEHERTMQERARTEPARPIPGVNAPVGTAPAARSAPTAAPDQDYSKPPPGGSPNGQWVTPQNGPPVWMEPRNIQPPAAAPPSGDPSAPYGYVKIPVRDGRTGATISEHIVRRTDPPPAGTPMLDAQGNQIGGGRQQPGQVVPITPGPGRQIPPNQIPGNRTGYSQQDREGLIQRGRSILDEHTRQTGQQPQQEQQRQAPGPGGQRREQEPQLRAPPTQQRQEPKESQEDRDYRIKLRAYEAFPYASQRTQRGRYEQQLDLQERRAAGRGGAGGGMTPEQKLAQEEYKQQNLNYRARIASDDRNLRTQAMRDNNWITNATKALTSSQREYFLDYRARQKAWDGANPGVPYELANPEQAARDKQMFQKLFTNAANNGLDFTQPQTPEPGGQRERPPVRGAPAAPAQPTTPQTQQQPAGPPGAPAWLPKLNLNTYKGEKPPQALTPEEKQNWQWSHFEDGTGWMLVPRKPPPAPAAPARAPAPAPRSQAPVQDQSLIGMP